MISRPLQNPRHCGEDRNPDGWSVSREGWNHEAQEFTPWLSKEEDLTLLGETLDIELELEAQEQSVGPFSTDMLERFDKAFRTRVKKLDASEWEPDYRELDGGAE